MTQDVSYRQFTGTAAEIYERVFVPGIAAPVAGPLIEAAGLRPGERVLDVACGTGIIARLAAERVGSDGAVTGVDVAPDMIEIARSLPAPEGAPITWREGDAQSLPLADESVDCVLSQMGLMFVEDKAAALAETRRVIAPGGGTVLSVPGAIQPPLAEMANALSTHISAELAGFVHVVFSMYDPTEIEQLLTEAGFTDVEAWTTSSTLRLPPPAEFLWSYINLTPMGPIVNAAPEDAKNALEADYVRACAPFATDGATVWEQPMVLARGRA